MNLKLLLQFYDFWTRNSTIEFFLRNLVISHKCSLANSDVIIAPVSAILILEGGRTLISGECLQSNLISEWHQYDGIMSRAPEGGVRAFFSETFGKMIGTYYEQLVKRTK